MRDIEFQGKRLDNGEWVEGYVFDDGIAGSKRMFVGGVVITDNRGMPDDRYEVGVDFCEVIPETVGRYTGWMDCKAQKIFEGHIIKISLPITGCNPIVGVSEVYFDKGCFCVNWGGSYRPHHRARIDSFIPETTFEVIGNIHDNPELLEL